MFDFNGLNSKMSDALLKPLDSFLGHVFHVDEKNKTKWNRMSEQSVNVSFLYDENKFIYKIFSMEDENVLINSTITSAMLFTKTSQKFGQWSDVKMSSTYGIGFTSDSTLNLFSEKFNEFKENVRKGIAPSAIGKSSLPSPIRTPSPLPSMFSFNGSLHTKSVSSNASTNSIEDGKRSPRSHCSSNSSTVDSNLKYENDKLKKALAQSSLNAKKWESEFQILKNNNARLTAALQESCVNVEKWKEQLTNYKEENARLREKVDKQAKISHNGDSEVFSNNDNTPSVQEFEQKLRLAQDKLKQKDEEVKRLAHHGSGELNLLREKNNELQKRLKLKQDENKMLIERAKQAVNTDMRMKQINFIKDDVDKKLTEITSLQQKMSTLFFQPDTKSLNGIS